MATTTFGTHSNVESTMALLEEELPRLEERQNSLERELAAVSERLEGVRAALRGLRALSAVPIALPEMAALVPASLEAEDVKATTRPRRSGTARRQAAGEPNGDVSARPRRATATRAAASLDAASGSAGTRKAATKGSRRTASKSKKGAVTNPPAAATAVATAAQPAAPRKRASGLTDSILGYLATAQEPVRAGDVAQALGRETTPGSLNAVRTSLERLVKASRAQRTGRGLYQAIPR